MADTQDIQSLSPITKGMITEEYVDYKLAPEDACVYLENLDNNTIGSLTSRRQFLKNTFAIAGTINYVKLFTTPSSSYYLVYQDGTTLKYIDATQFISLPTVVSIGALTGVGFSDTQIEQIEGKMLIANRGQSLKYWDGTTYANVATNFSNQTNVISAGFNGRIWGFDSADTTCKLYYSDRIPTTGIINTTGGSTNFLGINTVSGDRLTALKKTLNTLYVFSNNGIYRVFSPTNADVTPISYVGTPSQKAVTDGKDGTYFINHTGIFKLTDGGAPQEISQPIRQIIQKTSSQGILEAVAWSDMDNVYFSLGSSILGYQSDRVWIIKYNIDTQTFSLISSVGMEVKHAVSNNPGSVSIYSSVDYYPTTFVCGMVDGSGSISSYNVYNKTYDNVNVGGDHSPADSENTIGTPIFIKYITNWKVFGSAYSLKTLSEFFIESVRGSGLNIYYQTDNDSVDKWKKIGKLNESHITVISEFRTKSFSRIRFMVSGETKGEKVVLGQPGFGALTYDGQSK